MESLPYHQIPDCPEVFTPGAAIGRVVDGLGFRYHWATDGLGQSDLEYRPGPSNRTIGETASHIHALVSMVQCGLNGERYQGDPSADELSFDELRSATLETIRDLSERLKLIRPEDLEAARLRFGGKKDYEFPFWNALNGPLADALYHVGQIVGYRRAAGNAMDPGVNVFLGRHTG